MKKIIYIVLFLVLFFGLIKVFLPGLNDSPCILTDNFNKLDINGIVIKKYIDSDQHSYPILKIRSNNGLDTVLTINLVLEKSGLFERINPLDTLYKHKDSNEIYIQQDNRLRLIGKADFGCVEKSELKK